MAKGICLRQTNGEIPTFTPLRRYTINVDELDSLFDPGVQFGGKISVYICMPEFPMRNAYCTWKSSRW
jgi:hypothetical protein